MTVVYLYKYRLHFSVESKMHASTRLLAGYYLNRRFTTYVARSNFKIKKGQIIISGAPQFQLQNRALDFDLALDRKRPAILRCDSTRACKKAFSESV